LLGCMAVSSGSIAHSCTATANAKKLQDARQFRECFDECNGLGAGESRQCACERCRALLEAAVSTSCACGDPSSLHGCLYHRATLDSCGACEPASADAVRAGCECGIASHDCCERILHQPCEDSLVWNRQCIVGAKSALCYANTMTTSGGLFVFLLVLGTLLCTSHRVFDMPRESYCDTLGWPRDRQGATRDGVWQDVQNHSLQDQVGCKSCDSTIITAALDHLVQKWVGHILWQDERQT